MTEEEIKVIIRKKINEIGRLSKAIDNNFNKETIHNFRVRVKTLRSFLRLLRMHIDKPGLKMPKQFKRLYHIAGAIRDAQLELETISDRQAGMEQYLNKLHRMLDRQKKEWGKYYSKKTVQKLKDRLNGRKYGALPTEVLEKFFNDRASAINLIIRRRAPTDADIHSVRKKIKDILYTSKLAGKKWTAANKLVDSLPVTQLDRLAVMIGSYNDERQMLEHLKSFSSPVIKQDEKELIKTLRNNVVRDLTAKKKSIITGAKKLNKIQKAFR